MREACGSEETGSLQTETVSDGDGMAALLLVFRVRSCLSAIIARSKGAILSSSSILPRNTTEDLPTFTQARNHVSNDSGIAIMSCIEALHECRLTIFLCSTIVDNGHHVNDVKDVREL